GRTLLAKTALFTLVAAIGAYHLGVVRYATQHAATATMIVVQRMRRSLPLEAALAIIIVGIAGVLTSLPHPGTAPGQLPVVATPTVAPEPASVIAEATAAPEELASPSTPQPFTAIQSAGDLRVALHVEPAVVGRNLMRIIVTDTANQPREVQRIQVTLRLNDRDIGETSVIAEPDGQGRYVVRDQVL
ncbi:MAG: CopD family protein, partial [Roseiflexaceae bacterium]|nr:CopD family protein [Roseiflexaceae bacterium]